jgi:hypothetical protein
MGLMMMVMPVPNLLFASRDKNWVQLLTLLRVLFPPFCKNDAVSLRKGQKGCCHPSCKNDAGSVHLSQVYICRILRDKSNRL